MVVTEYGRYNYTYTHTRTTMSRTTQSDDNDVAGSDYYKINNTVLKYFRKADAFTAHKARLMADYVEDEPRGFLYKTKQFF